MARWLSFRIDQTANASDGAGKFGAPATDEAACLVLDAAPPDERLGLVLSVPAEATHAVRIAFDKTPASDRHGAFTVQPGGVVDTTQLPAALQPTGRVTAWSGPALDTAGTSEPGRILLDVTELLPD